ncbi:phage tail tape measure protein [Chondrinema litorale]|uniref:phage tail tape measure protein n=1 Tax=Chondrinema litorale TaxID=2994555 RepID=UPI002542E29B|nr:phage tail tape measure protein [Chondrinema litorale]UZR93152.1 phage tail tape measure protein [Chondrinema litorale]
MALKERIQVQVEIGSDQAKKALNDLMGQADTLRAELKGMKKNTDEYRQASAKLKETESQIVGLRKKIGLTALPLKELQKESRRLQRELFGLVPGTDAFIKKSKELDRVKARIGQVKTGMNGVSKATGLMNNAFGQLQKAFIALFAFQKFIELGQYLLGIDEKYTKLSGTIQQLSGLQGEALSEATAHVQALGNTFDVEQNKIADTANAVSKRMKISYSEALDLIEEGMLAAPGKGEELLEQAKEYATQFADAGASAEEMFAVITQSINEGVFSDKGADVVKEFGLRIREQTKSTSEAMQAAFGKEFTDEIFKGINDGSLSTVDALKRVSSQMNDTTIPANKLQTVVADVFGGPGEDAGLDFLKSLKSINGSMEGLIDTENALTRTQIKQLSLEKELAQAEEELAEKLAGSSALWSELTTYLQILGTKTLVWVIDKFNELKNGFIDLYNSSLPLRGILNGLVLVFKTLFNANMAFMTSFQEGIIGLGKGVLALISGDFSKIGDIFSETTASIQGKFTELGKDVATSFKEAMDETLNGKITINSDQIASEAKKVQEDIGQASLETRKKYNDRLSEEDKKVSEKLSKAREEAKKKELAAQKSLEDLRIQLMQEGAEKEIAQLKLNTKRKIEALVGTPEQIAEQTLLLKESLKNELGLLQEEVEQAQRDKDLELSIESEEIKKLRLEEQFERSLLDEQAYQDALYELQKAAMEERIKLLESYHGQESAEVMVAKVNLAKIEREHADKTIENEKKTAELKKGVEQASFQAASDFLQMGIDLLGKDEVARKKNADKIKAFSIAKILVDLQQEIAGYMASPDSTMTFGVAGAIKSAIAVARAGMAVSTVSKQKFASGGIIDGPSHSEGGIQLINPSNMQVMGEIEGGEPILSKMTYLNNKPIIDKLLDASMNKGGTAISQATFENGGTLPTTSSSPTSSSDLSIANTESAINQTANTDNALLLRQVLTQLQILNQKFPLEITSKLVYTDFEKAKKRIDEDEMRGSL